jgi:hypothetical protein
MDIIEISLIILQAEVFFILIALIFMIFKFNKHAYHKPDPLLRHFKEYLADDLKFSQVKQKLLGMGFDKERVDKLVLDFLRH